MEPKTVYVARNSTEASIVQGWLVSAGIDAKVFDGEMQGGVFDIVDSDPQVLVNVDDFEKAVEIVRQFQSELQQSTDMSAVSDAEGQFDWPMCPVCDEMRSARCEKCDSIGNEYSTDEQNQKIVTCLACSQETTLVFLEKCRFCEHDFTGATADNVSLTARSAEAANSQRMLVLVAGLVGLGILLAIWLVMATG